jgi:DNA-binding transcriptional ArsR family regulator
MRTTLTVDRPDSVPVSVVLAPGLSVLALITDTLSGRARGAPESWRRLIRSATGPGDETVVGSLASPGHSVVPDLVLPGDPVRDVRVETQIEILRDLPVDTLLAQLEEITDGRPPPHWRPAVDRPQRWLRGYADLVERAWRAMAPVWRRARPLLDREIERVAVAAARGSLDVVLNGLHAGCRFQNDAFSFPDVEPAWFSMDSRRLVLKPMLAGPTSLISRLDAPDFVWVGYPLPGLGALTSPPRPRGRDDPLVLMIGDVRATILRSLDRPLTMSGLAHVIMLAPNAVTYHCGRLETAGLILRQRSGREIHVHRTDRATALVNLFGA